MQGDTPFLLALDSTVNVRRVLNAKNTAVSMAVMAFWLVVLESMVQSALRWLVMPTIWLEGFVEGFA